VVHGSATDLLIVSLAYFVTAQRTLNIPYPAVRPRARAVLSRGSAHASNLQNARSTRRERRTHPTPSLIV
jgi:hypothetical protein